MTNNERLTALTALAKTRGATMELVTLRMEKLTESDVNILMKLFSCKRPNLEDEIHYVWIRYFKLREICGRHSLEVLSLP